MRPDATCNMQDQLGKKVLQSAQVKAATTAAARAAHLMNGAVSTHSQHHVYPGRSCLPSQLCPSVFAGGEALLNSEPMAAQLRQNL